MACSRFFVATVYVSEARRETLLSKLRAIAQGKGSLLLSHFVDTAYERSSFCLGGTADGLLPTISALTRESVDSLDFREHRGSHPALGVVDHISVAPLNDDDLESAAVLARSVAASVSALGVGCLLYGAAHPARRSLAATRRCTPYFTHTKDMALAVSQMDVALLDVGGRVRTEAGVCLCGAAPHVLNFNVQLQTKDEQIAKNVAKLVRTRNNDGSLPGVEAMALPHDDGFFEVACNLLDVTKSPPEAVLQRLTEIAHQQGTEIKGSYVIGLTKKQLIEKLASPPHPHHREDSE